MERARDLAQRLHRVFLPTADGIFGEHQMPEDVLPVGIDHGSREQLLFLMLIVSVDYMRSASDLWCAGREAWADQKLRYLFEPQQLGETGYRKAETDLKRCGLTRKTRRDARAWFTIARTLATKWSGDPRRFLDDCQYNAPTILRRLRSDHHRDGNTSVADFPHLRGPKIGPLWIRMLRDNAGIELFDLDQVPIPVDIHVLRATICAGALRGQFAGSITEVFAQVRRLWGDATRGLALSDGKAMVALDIDEALWTLSRLGCSKRGNGKLDPCPENCPAAPGCTQGRIRIQRGRCEIDTMIRS